jgi:hypothetical protein
MKVMEEALLFGVSGGMALLGVVTLSLTTLLLAVGPSKGDL